MKREKGIAYCGLACAVCGHNQDCVGCRQEGCQDKEWCKNFRCCQEKGLLGCWQCSAFPCNDSMFSKLKIRAFASFIKNYGTETLLNCLAENEKLGIVYHYPGQIIGDYDQLETEEEIFSLLLKKK